MGRGRVFSRECKLGVVRQVVSGEKRPARACREHGIAEGLLLRWRREYEARGDAAFAPHRPSAVEALERRIADLERLCGQLALENAVLQGALRGCRSRSAKGQARQATPLTQANRSAGRDGIRVGARKEPHAVRAPLPTACKGCGVILDDSARVWCVECYAEHRAEKDRRNLTTANATRAKMRAQGRDPSHGGGATEKRRATHLEQQRLNAEWETKHRPTMTEDEFRTRVLPRLADVPVRSIAAAMVVSRGYASMVRSGERVPHPRHWETLASLSVENH